MSRPTDPHRVPLREETARSENIRDWRVDGATREFAALHALLDSQLSQIADRLALLATRSGNLGPIASCGSLEHVLAIRRLDGTYKVRESAIVAELADLHLALSTNLEEAAEVFRNRFGEAEAAVVLVKLAEHHKKDAAMLRALLRDRKPQ